MPGLILQMEPTSLAEVISARTGVAVHSALPEVGEFACLRLSDLPERKGLSIRLSTTWRGIEAVVRPDNLAGSLVRQMGAATAEAKAKFSQFCYLLSAAGLRVTVRVNENVLREGSMPSEPWTSMDLRVSVLADPDSPAHLGERAKAVCCACVSAVLCLLETEEIDPNPLGEEGAKLQTLGVRYERSAANRSACIALQGTKCKVCGFDFEEVYGPLGAGFIEIHHLTPVSLIGAGYIVNPAFDLIPLCSNCHSMVHRQYPPVKVEDLRELYLTGRGAPSASSPVVSVPVSSSSGSDDA